MPLERCSNPNKNVHYRTVNIITIISNGLIVKQLCMFLSIGTVMLCKYLRVVYKAHNLVGA